MSYTLEIGWKPRYSPDGSRLTWERTGYWEAQWLTNAQEIAQNGSRLVLGPFPGIATDWLGASELSAGAGTWAAFRPDPVRVYTSWGQVIPGAGCPTLNPDGRFGYVDNRQASVKNLIWNGAIVSTGAITDVRASRTALVWSDGGRTWGVRLDRPDAAQEIQAAPVEFRPIPIDTPEGPWVGNHTDTGLVCRPYGSTDGYRFDNGGQAYYPDWKYQNGAIIAIFTNDTGVQAEHRFDLSEQRVPLGVTPPKPTEPPKPEPQPPRQEPPQMAIPDRATALPIVERIRNKYPRREPGSAPLAEDAQWALIEVAQAFGAQIFRKEAGERVFIDALGKSANRAIIGRGAFGNQWVKVFSDSEGKAGPIWNIGDTPADGEYLDVSRIQIPGVVVVTPEPGTGDRVRELEAAIRKMVAIGDGVL